MLNFLYEYIKVDEWGTSANIDRYLIFLCRPGTIYSHVQQWTNTSYIWRDRSHYFRRMDMFLVFGSFCLEETELFLCMFMRKNRIFTLVIYVGKHHTISIAQNTAKSIWENLMLGSCIFNHNGYPNVDNTETPLRYYRGDSVVVFQYYQQKYVTLRTSWSNCSSAVSFPVYLARWFRGANG